MANRRRRQLVELEDAISRVRTERERVRVAIDDERARLERLGLEETRLGADAANAVRRIERLRQQGDAQRGVIELLEAEVARAREAGFAGAVRRGETQLRSGAARRARRAQLEQSRSEIARCSAEHASALVTLESTPAASPAANDLSEIATRRARIEAELAVERRRRDAIPAARVGTNLVELVGLEGPQPPESGVVRLQRRAQALA